MALVGISPSERPVATVNATISSCTISSQEAIDAMTKITIECALQRGRVALALAQLVLGILHLTSTLQALFSFACGRLLPCVRSVFSSHYKLALLAFFIWLQTALLLKSSCIKLLGYFWDLR